LYFFVAAPSLFFPMGAVIWNSKVLPRAFGALAFVLGSGFFVVGITTLYDPILSDRATSLAAVQAFWWLGAAIVLMARSKRFADVPA
jgi:hypothetical protein